MARKKAEAPVDAGLIGHFRADCDKVAELQRVRAAAALIADHAAVAVANVRLVLAALEAADTARELDRARVIALLRDARAALDVLIGPPEKVV